MAEEANRVIACMWSVGFSISPLSAYKQDGAAVMQALGKARGDGLGMEFAKADFSITCTNEGWRATVEIDGAEKPRSDSNGK